MRTSLKDVIKINKEVDVRFSRTLDNLMIELKRQISNKKRNNEHCLFYTIPIYKIGDMSYDRRRMYNEIYDKIRLKYHIVSKLPQFKIYIEWRTEPRQDNVMPILRHLDNLIIQNANMGRSFCTYTLPVSVGKDAKCETNRILKRIIKAVKSSGFKVETKANTIVIHLVLDSKSDPKPKIVQDVKVQDTPCPVPVINSDNYACVLPIDTRRDKSDIMSKFKLLKKQYDNLDGYKCQHKSLFPEKLNVKNKPKVGSHVLTRRTVIGDDEIQNQLQELDEISKKLT
jgi:hypothetical protein